MWPVKQQNLKFGHGFNESSMTFALLDTTSRTHPIQISEPILNTTLDLFFSD